ncbi:MAG: hypothetical protein KC451_11590 [Amylibacter sp.]|nr:hypothetical protein [Amylibacter sp.]
MISKTVPYVARIAAVSVFALGLSGCIEASDLTPVSASKADVIADTKIVNVNGTAVTLGRTDGYCFNDQQSKITTTGAFVVLAPCDPLDEGSTAKGLILINVLDKDGIMAAIKSHDLEGYFQSDKGRAALSRRGNADKVTVLGTMEDDGIYYVHTRDADGPVIPDTTDDQWRVFFVVADRLVSVSVVNFIDDQMTDGLVFGYAEAVAKRIRSLN